MPYVVFSFVWWGFKMLFAGNVNSAVSIKDLLFIVVYPISFMWFIYALLIMVVIQILIGRKAQGKWFSRIHLLTALLLLLINPYLNEWLSDIAFGDCVLSDVMRNYLYFLTGFYGSKHIVGLVNSRYRFGLACLTGIVLLAGNTLLYGLPYCDGAWMKIVVALCGCMCMLLLCKCMENASFINYIGKCSLSVYVLQGLAIAATRQALAIVYHPTTNEMGWLPWTVCTVMGTLIPLAIYWCSTRTGKLDFVFTPTKYLKLKSNSHGERT